MMNNKTLALVFGALLIIYLLTKVLGGNRESSFDPNILSIDTSTVTRIVVDPAENEGFELEKTGAQWEIIQGDQKYVATTESVKGLLSNLTSITAERVVTKNADRYADYSVDETGGTRIQLFGGSDKIGDVMVGRFNFNQATRSGVSYFKRSSEPEVYAVDGFMSMTLSQGFDNYRNKDLVSINTQDLTRVTIGKDDGTSMQMQKRDSIWVNATGEILDSTAVASYVSKLGMVRGTAFINGQEDVGGAIKSLTLEGNNMPAPIRINCYQSQDTSHHFVIHSSANEEGYFFSDSTGLYDRLFGTTPFISN